MSQTEILIGSGAMPLGLIPRVVGTVSSADCLSWIAQLSAENDLPCDIIEVRLDEIGAENTVWRRACQTIEAVSIPIIVTVRMKKEGGKWTGTEKQRLKILTSALQEVSAVDIELKSDIVSEVAGAASAARKPVVISYHDFDKTPSLSKLKEVAAKAAAYDSAVVKVSTLVNSSADIDTLRALLDEGCGSPLCVIGMGANGTWTRTAFPQMGSCLTYGYLDTPSAPGQLPCSSLTEHLRVNAPAYNQDVIGRKQILEFV